jgi:hypothetical protein
MRLALFAPPLRRRFCSGSANLHSLDSHWIRTMYRCLFVAFWAAALIAPASAQLQRQFPQTALRGEIVVGAPPVITLNGEAARLAPGARIRGQNNMIEMSGALIGARLLVHYTIDPQGQVKDVWILRPDEAAKQPWPTNLKDATNWSFDPIAQTWTRP